MSNCCSKTSSAPNSSSRQHCPDCQKMSAPVKIITLLQHIKEPWQWHIDSTDFFFCKTAECPVCYFSDTGIQIKKQQLRTRIGIKEKDEDTFICYCFGITKKQYLNKPELKQFILNKTREKLCACDIRNPSGRCCLGDL